ncbi:NO-inducible flavohemoprotein [Bacillus haynesii]|uniref:NO-inducible flavohemoprotein n=1 Tax=Bacillus haynesii TaxID=1925021 RepID=UPI00159317A7|nr:NO-inducible flavohemoprotein [Bacillus haynesii]NVB34129.1 NO-inducible flavohemoprotein [Bacillus licheniformis]MCY7776920.1 NO-inducible flavohemoprotein [Bacillus haynesii]MCY7816510.1 NO-inducible flavohemoprotein [Bacillus haynesii]MCY8223452.1 NO-inducible flavohemoprotein [Bacillus haynesii]MCY8241502.1 NO-inducible flavohemoprotein [Bacillus haynesii]
MLSEKTMQIVKSTAPVLKEKGTEITTCFYKRMFNAHPELKNIFNMSRQQTGGQPKALAFTVLQAAENIDRLGDLLPVVKQIGHKHKSLHVKPEHYPIVGQHLLEAIEIVLGEAATEDILQAWAEAYEEIARVFIEVEKQMYEEDKKQDGNWEGFKPFVIMDKRVESDTITSFYLKPADGTDLPAFSPGQYVSVRIKIPGEPYFLTRQYSLSDAWNKDYYRISVKLEAEEGQPIGRVSSYLHENMEIGGSLEVSAPAGEFTLSEGTDHPVYFISAGSGITPVMSMVQTLAHKESSREITFVHAAKTERHHAFKAETEKLLGANSANRLLYVYSRGAEATEEHTVKGRVNEELLKSVVKDPNGEFYVCGPLSFMKSVIEGLQNLGVSMENIRYESFASSLDMQIAN